MVFRFLIANFIVWCLLQESSSFASAADLDLTALKASAPKAHSVAKVVIGENLSTRLFKDQSEVNAKNRFLNITAVLLVKAVNLLDKNDFLKIRATCVRLYRLSSEPSLFLPESSDALSQLITDHPSQAVLHLYRSPSQEVALKSADQVKALSAGFRAYTKQTDGAVAVSRWKRYSQLTQFAILAGDKSVLIQYQKALDGLCYNIQQADLLLAGEVDCKPRAKRMRAFNWALLACVDEVAQAYLVDAYEQGAGVPQDTAQGEFWRQLRPQNLLSSGRMKTILASVKEYPFWDLQINDEGAAVQRQPLSFPRYKELGSQG